MCALVQTAILKSVKALETIARNSFSELGMPFPERARFTSREVCRLRSAFKDERTGPDEILRSILRLLARTVMGTNGDGDDNIDGGGGGDA